MGTLNDSDLTSQFIVVALMCPSKTERIVVHGEGGPEPQGPEVIPEEM